MALIYISKIFTLDRLHFCLIYVKEVHNTAWKHIQHGKMLHGKTCTLCTMKRIYLLLHSCTNYNWNVNISAFVGCHCFGFQQLRPRHWRSKSLILAKRRYYTNALDTFVHSRIKTGGTVASASNEETNIREWWTTLLWIFLELSLVFPNSLYHIFSITSYKIDFNFSCTNWLEFEIDEYRVFQEAEEYR